MNVLVLLDDFWHPAEVIEMGLQPLEKEGFRFTFVKDALDILTPEFMAEYPVIMCCKGNSINGYNTKEWFRDTGEVGPREFEAYIRAGGGFLSVHSGNTGRDGNGLSGLLGNSFVGHPPRCDVSMRIAKEHPVTRNVKDFTVRDEHYEIKVTDPQVDVFLTGTSETGGTQVAGYTKNLGEGRVCVLTPGHILSVWTHPEYQKILVNALHYCAKTDI